MCRIGYYLSYIDMNSATESCNNKTIQNDEIMQFLSGLLIVKKKEKIIEIIPSKSRSYLFLVKLSCF